MEISFCLGFFSPNSFAKAATSGFILYINLPDDWHIFPAVHLVLALLCVLLPTEARKLQGGPGMVNLTNY